MDKKLKYYDLMEDLRKQIVSGKIKPGEKLPSENELSGTYQVSRQTQSKSPSFFNQSLQCNQIQKAGRFPAPHPIKSLLLLPAVANVQENKAA